MKKILTQKIDDDLYIEYEVEEFGIGNSEIKQYKFKKIYKGEEECQKEMEAYMKTKTKEKNSEK